MFWPGSQRMDRKPQRVRNPCLPPGPPNAITSPAFLPPAPESRPARFRGSSSAEFQTETDSRRWLAPMTDRISPLPFWRDPRVKGFRRPITGPTAVALEGLRREAGRQRRGFSRWSEGARAGQMCNINSEGHHTRASGKVSCASWLRKFRQTQCHFVTFDYSHAGPPRTEE